MHKKFEINRTKIKGSCQSGRKMATHDSKSDLPLSKSKGLRKKKEGKLENAKKSKTKANSTQCSQAVSHPSTN